MIFLDTLIVDNRLSWLNKTSGVTPADLAQCAARELGVLPAVVGWGAWPGLYFLGHATGCGRLCKRLRGARAT